MARAEQTQKETVDRAKADYNKKKPTATGMPT